jgi:hypothetical protein
MLCSTQGCVNGQNKHESGIYVPGVVVGARVLLFTGSSGGSRNKRHLTCLEAEDPEPEAEASPIGGFIAKTSQALLQASSDRGAGGQAAAAARRLTGGRGDQERTKRPRETGWTPGGWRLGLVGLRRSAAGVEMWGWGALLMGLWAEINYGLYRRLR